MNTAIDYIAGDALLVFLGFILGLLISMMSRKLKARTSAHDAVAEPDQAQIRIRQIVDQMEANNRRWEEVLRGLYEADARYRPGPTPNYMGTACQNPFAIHLINREPNLQKP